MEIKRIIISILVFLMLFVNSFLIFAEETEEHDFQNGEFGEQSIFENNRSINPSINVDTSNYNGYIKPATDSYDDGEGIYQMDKFASYYFYTLQEQHFGNNTHGSCGYVATAMLLSYYDTYWDDNIIDEQYDEVGTIASNFDLSDENNNSPGIKSELISLPSSEGLNTGDYWNFIANNCEDYFHLYLIKLAEDEFNMYHNTIGILEECGIAVEIDSENPCASTMLHQKSLIQHYLYEEQGYTESDFSLEYVNTDVRNFAINKIKNGQPVLLLLGNATDGFHFVVAYDLDDKGTSSNEDDDIYAHYGWSNYETHINIDTDNYPLLVSAMAINFTIPHSHSNNYVDSSGNTYCSCCFSIHPEHECSYFSEYNEEYHVCVVDGNQFSHNFECYGTSSGIKHYEICSDCGYVSQRLSYPTYSSINGAEHSMGCSNCDYAVDRLHSLKYTNTGDGTHRVTCESCDYEEQKSHNYEYSDKNSSHHDISCKNCSYTATVSHNYVCNGMTGTTHNEICSDCSHEQTGLTNASYTSIDASYHSVECLTCGYTVSSVSHDLEYRTTGNTYHEQYCVDCGYVAARSRHVLQLTGGVGNLKQCQICGAMVNVGGGGGGIFPVEPTKEDDEEETE